MKGFILLLLGTLQLAPTRAFAPSPTHYSVSTRALTTRIFSSTDGDFMASLQRRMEEVSQKDNTLPLVVLDSMLPRQVLNITVQNGLLMELVRTRLQAETPSLGMVGNAKLADGRGVTLNSGVEVEMIGKPIVTEDGKLKLSLRGARRFRVIEDTIETTDEGWTEATIKYLNSTVDDTAEASSEDPMSIARAMQMAREFTDPNFSLAEAKSLVDRWLDLARKRERKPGQIDQLLVDLGPMPEWKMPTECAMWVGALINPIPALGVALEIRPKLLIAKTAEARTQIALDGIWNSILRMEASDRSKQQTKE